MSKAWSRKLRYVVKESVYTIGGLHVDKDRRPLYLIKKDESVLFIADTPGDALAHAKDMCKQKIKIAIQSLEHLTRLECMYERQD
jgi:hypothetical protein